MILSRGRGYLFIHIPKTGGTSMALALEARAMKDDIMLGDTPKALKRRGKVQGIATRGRLWKHSTLADLEGLVGAEELPSLFKFTLVRNPWDRMVSYYHWLREQSFDHPSVALAQAVEFADFVRDPGTGRQFRQSPASQYMTDAAGLEQCDLYLRLEHFRDDVVALERHLGFAISLPQANISPREGDYRDYYTPGLRDLVATLCAEDIARFGYRF